MRKVNFKNEMQLPNETINKIKKDENKPIGTKKRLTIIKNEVLTSTSPKKPKTNQTGQRASLFNILTQNNNNTFRKQKSASMERTPLASIKGEAAVLKGKNYSIVNPLLDRERSASSNRKSRYHNKMLINNRSMEEEYECTDKTKKGTVEIYRVNLFKPIRKVKDENYYASLIQDEWKKYRERQLEKEYAMIRRTRRFVNILNTFCEDYYINLKKGFINKLVKAKPKEIEVTAQEYYLIQHLKELGIYSVMDFRKTVSAIVNGK